MKTRYFVSEIIEGFWILKDNNLVFFNKQNRCLQKSIYPTAEQLKLCKVFNVKEILAEELVFKI